MLSSEVLNFGREMRDDRFEVTTRMLVGLLQLVAPQRVDGHATRRWVYLAHSCHVTCFVGGLLICHFAVLIASHVVLSGRRDVVGLDRQFRGASLSDP